VQDGIALGLKLCRDVIRKLPDEERRGRGERGEDACEEGSKAHGDGSYCKVCMYGAALRSEVDERRTKDAHEEMSEIQRRAEQRFEQQEIVGAE
jgi:hypothetical protein